MASLKGLNFSSTSTTAGTIPATEIAAIDSELTLEVEINFATVNLTPFHHWFVSASAQPGFLECKSTAESAVAKIFPFSSIKVALTPEEPRSIPIRFLFDNLCTSRIVNKLLCAIRIHWIPGVSVNF